MMKAMKLPLTFWAEAVKHAIYILNRVPTRALVDKTPYEAPYNRKPNLENLRIFGCTAYAKITIPHLKKLDDRSIPMIYLGVEEGSKACRLYDPKGKRKHVSRDVRFMETKPWDWDNNGKETSTQDTFWASFMEPITDPDSPITPPAYTYNPNSEEEKEATISSLMNSEYRFDDTPTKRDAKGKIIKYKARLVAKGYVQEQGIDFDEVFAPVAWIKTVHLILALAAYHGWQMEEKFEMSDLGLLAYYLGIEVTQTGGVITIGQTGYINKILKKTSMMKSNDTKIPMDPDTKLVKAEDGNSVDATYYRSLIGSLRYLLHTRPDLSYSVGLLSRFMQDLKDHHLKAVKQVVRYIKGTKEHGIIYKKEGGCKITGYSDSSYGINTDQGKGTIGIVFYFGESPITWCTQKQPMVGTLIM
nr:ribonuclease H-like domain, reverse transcriptase, RNA-dependent DNA polymerase [Tanacetum cinerariifolium]